jgi:hypothetical protein
MAGRHLLQIERCAGFRKCDFSLRDCGDVDVGQELEIDGQDIQRVNRVRL